MALVVDIDIADAYVSQPAFSVLDGIIRAKDLSNFAVTNIWVPASDLAITLMPLQLTPAWASTAGKYQLTDWGLSAGWEQVAHRSANDWFMNSRGVPAATPIGCTHNLAANAGLCFEFVALSSAHTIVRDMYILEFGTCFRLHIHSNGTADFEDTRPSAIARPLLIEGADLTAGGQDLSGKYCQVVILPWRRGYVFVWSSQGGFFEVYVGARTDTSTTLKPSRTSGEPCYYVITEAAAPKLTPSALCRSFWSMSQLQYPATGSIKSSLITLPSPTTVPPSTHVCIAEQQDLTTATLSLVDNTGAVFAPTATAPLTQLQYSIALASPAVGVAPVVFSTQVEFDRALSNRTYGTSTVKTTHAHLSMSRDRSSKIFEFTVDNPTDAYTSLKDLWNRKVHAYTTVDTVDTVARDLFFGYADPADFIDGVASTITIPCSGLRKRLRYDLMSDARNFDGWNHTDMVQKVLEDGGVADTGMYIYNDGGVALDKADPGDDPIWKPANGTSRDEWIQHCCDVFSGWVFDDIGGVYYYAPREYFTAAAIANNASVPQILSVTPNNPLTGRAVISQPYPAALVAQNLRQPRPQEPRANDIWVLGRDPHTQQIIAVHYVDTASIGVRTASNYVGEVRRMVYASAAISTLQMATRAMGVIANRVTQPVRTVTFDLADYRSELPIEGAVNIQNYGIALITGLDADLTMDRNRVTSYCAELL